MDTSRGETGTVVIKAGLPGGGVLLVAIRAFGAEPCSSVVHRLRIRISFEVASDTRPYCPGKAQRGVTFPAWRDAVFAEQWKCRARMVKHHGGGKSVPSSCRMAIRARDRDCSVGRGLS